VAVKYDTRRGGWCSKEVGGSIWGGSVEMYSEGVG
jgi:hypothetical protein